MRTVHEVSRKEYMADVALRWHSEPLNNARRNWRTFQDHHDELCAILVPYVRDDCVEDMSGKCHNPDGTLTAWLWKNCEGESNPWIWDFCEHYQKVHLRRGIIQYCKQILSGQPGQDARQQTLFKTESP